MTAREVAGTVPTENENATDESKTRTSATGDRRDETENASPSTQNTQLSPTELAFNEGFESGQIDTNRWTLLGSPNPHVESGGFHSGAALDVSGDSWCDSGRRTKNEYPLAGRLLIFDAKVRKHFGNFQGGGVAFEGEPKP